MIALSLIVDYSFDLTSHNKILNSDKIWLLNSFGIFVSL